MILSLELSRSSSCNRIISERTQHVPADAIISFYGDRLGLESLKRWRTNTGSCYSFTLVDTLMYWIWSHAAKWHDFHRELANSTWYISRLYLELLVPILIHCLMVRVIRLCETWVDLDLIWRFGRFDCVQQGAEMGGRRAKSSVYMN